MAEINMSVYEYESKEVHKKILIQVFTKLLVKRVKG